MAFTTGFTPIRLLASLLVIAGLWLGFPNTFFSCPLLVLAYPAGLALLGHSAQTPKKAFLTGWLAASTGHILTLSWLTVPLSRVGGLPMAAAAPCAVLVAVALATQAGLFALLVRRFWQPASAASSLALALAWYFLEYGYALAAGFPWLPLSGALIIWPWTMQGADILGATLTGSLWAGAALMLTGALLTRQLRPLWGTMVLALALGSYGLWQLQAHPQTAATGPDEAAKALPRPVEDRAVFPVLLVEGNIDQNQKWVEAFRTQTVDTYVTLTREALHRARMSVQTGQTVPTDQTGQAEPFHQQDQAGRALADYLGRGLILWPETAMPFDLAHSRHTRRLMALCVEAGMPLLTGAPGMERGAGGATHVYNRVWLLDAYGSPAGSYDKEHLVPFGEYVPAFLRWDFLASLLQEVGAYSAGTRTAPLRQRSLALGPLICYEAVFPWLAQERVAKGANVLIDVSNDGWFGDTAAPWQHLALTGLRALEQNRWLVRCTNTGISAIFDARGRLVFSGPQFQAQALWAQARIEETTSLFHELFYVLPVFCALLLAGLLCLTRKPIANPSGTIRRIQ